MALGQTQRQLITKANELYQSGNYLESAQEFDKAFAISEGNYSQYYNAACS